MATSKGKMRSVFLLVMAARRTMGPCSLMTSGETTSAGRSPACSEPTAGSSLTRTTSPRFGWVFQDTMHFLFERMEFLFNLQIQIAHLPAALDHGVTQLFAPSAVQPILQEAGNCRASLTGRHKF